jgi:opacity protein-like surface antigen
VYAPGGGVEYRLWRNIWARGDYEYQTWSVFPTPTTNLHPQGFTAGITYDLKHIRQ